MLSPKINMTPTSVRTRPDAELGEMMVGFLSIAAVIALCVWGIPWLFAPNEATRVARAAEQAQAEVAYQAERKASLRRQAKPLFEKYRAGCGAVPYPSTYCPAWYAWPGDGGEDKNHIIADGPDESLAEHPCFEGQIKARQTTGFYYEPGDEFYAAAQRSILCFDSADEAEAQGYHLFTD